MPTLIAPAPGDIGCTQILGEPGRLIRIGEWLNGDGFADFEHCFMYLGAGLLTSSTASCTSARAC